MRFLRRSTLISTCLLFISRDNFQRMGMLAKYVNIFRLISLLLADWAVSMPTMSTSPINYICSLFRWEISIACDDNRFALRYDVSSMNFSLKSYFVFKFYRIWIICSKGFYGSIFIMLSTPMTTGTFLSAFYIH